jgi:hypothetical protein
VLQETQVAARQYPRFRDEVKFLGQRAHPAPFMGRKRRIGRGGKLLEGSLAMNTILKSRLGQCGLVAMSLTIVVLLIAATRGQSDSEMTRRNITRVLQADQALGRQRDDSIPKDAPPSVIALCVEHYCDGLENLDMSDCPADFRVAYHEHMRAWREMDAAIKQLPDSFADGLWEGFVNGLQGESDGGAGRMREDLKNASSSIESTWSVVECQRARKTGQ